MSLLTTASCSLVCKQCWNGVWIISLKLYSNVMTVVVEWLEMLRPTGFGRPIILAMLGDAFTALTFCLLDCSRVLPFHQVIIAGGRAPHDRHEYSYLRSAEYGWFTPTSSSPSGFTIWNKKKQEKIIEKPRSHS